MVEILTSSKGFGGHVTGIKREAPEKREMIAAQPSLIERKRKKGD